jgi:hypothetical protein
MQAQREIAAGGQHRVHVGGKVRQQDCELGEGVRRVQLVEIVDDQHDPAPMVFECCHHPLDHRPPVEAGGGGGRFRPAGGAGAMTDRVQQGKPEQLGILLVALHLDHGEPMPLARTVGPGAQQRRLPAAGGSRDDRHLRRRRAIERGEQRTAVDQPGGCPIHLQGLPWYPRRRPTASDTVPSVAGQHTSCQRYPNHHHPAMPSHLLGGEPGSVAEARTAAGGRAQDAKGAA